MCSLLDTHSSRSISLSLSLTHSVAVLLARSFILVRMLVLRNTVHSTPHIQTTDTNKWGKCAILPFHFGSLPALSPNTRTSGSFQCISCCVFVSSFIDRCRCPCRLPKHPSVTRCISSRVNTTFHGKCHSIWCTCAPTFIIAIRHIHETAKFHICFY